MVFISGRCALIFVHAMGSTYIGKSKCLSGAAVTQICLVSEWTLALSSEGLQSVADFMSDSGRESEAASYVNSVPWGANRAAS